jgi:hypothetical protein
LDRSLVDAGGFAPPTGQQSAYRGDYRFSLARPLARCVLEKIIKSWGCNCIFT